MTAIVAGSRVTVHDPRGDWQGYVRQMPDGPYERGGPMPPAVVAVHQPQASGLAVYSVHRVPCRFLGAPYQATASTKTSRTEPATARGRAGGEPQPSGNGLGATADSAPTLPPGAGQSPPPGD